MLPASHSHASHSHIVSSNKPLMAGAMRPPRHVVVHALLAFVLCIAFPAGVLAEAAASRNGMVVAQESRAARVGVEILEKGGNAVDAAVATGFALAVTYPRAGNIGGGGYMLIHLAGANRQIAIDYRETAPKATTPDIFLNEKGDPDP